MNKGNFYYADEHIIVADDGRATDVMTQPLIRLCASLVRKLDEFTGLLRHNGTFPDEHLEWPATTTFRNRS